MSKPSGNTTSLAIASFLLGSAVTSLASFYLSTKSDKKKNASSCTTKDDNISTHNTSQKQIIIPPEIRAEQLSRNELYFGPAGMESITNARILIVGLGGVGSHTAHMLARAGVSYLRLVDFDQVTLSSLNRHACATLEDVGIPKVECMKRFLYKVCGECCEIDARVQMYTGDAKKDGDDLVKCPDGKQWDVVIDAIDDVPTKARLLLHCVRNNIRVISCMGAGGKSDMTRLHISDLKSASRDPLASKLRQVLKKSIKKLNMGQAAKLDQSFLEDMDKVAILYSSEKVVVKLADFTEEQKKEGIHKFGAVDNMRIRVIPVLGTMPAIMGQSLAAMALCEIGKKPFSPMCGERVGRNIRHRLLQHFKNREKKICDEIEKDSPPQDVEAGANNDTSSGRPMRIVKGRWIGPIQIDSDDVEYILSEVWRNRCCVSGDALGTVLEIARWDLSKPSNCQNLVLLGVKAMAKFDEAATKTGDGRNSVPQDLRKKIEDRLTSCKIDSRA